MKYLTLFMLTLSACNTLPPTPYPTYTAYPTSTPYPPQDEAFLKAVQERVNKDESIPQAGRDALIALLVNQPGYAFTDGMVLQFNIPTVPDSEPGIKSLAVLLMGAGIVMAQDHSMPLSGIEVVDHLADGKPWLVLAPPWDMVNDLGLAPLRPDCIKRLIEAGVITPTPEPTY